MKVNTKMMLIGIYIVAELQSVLLPLTGARIAGLSSHSYSRPTTYTSKFQLYTSF